MYKQAKNLIFIDFEWNNNGIFFFYSLDEYHFHYKLRIKSNILNDIILNYPVKKRDQLNPFLLHTGIALSIPIIKTYNPTNIYIKASQLEENYINLWRKWLIKGFGEYFYKNNLDHNINISVISDKKYPSISTIKLDNIALLPNGGGKDSIVSSELLNSINLKYIWTTLGRTSYRKKVINVSNESDYVDISYTSYINIPNIYKTYRGHMPYTLYTSSLFTLLAGILSKKYIIYSNEKSSSFPNLNILYQGQNIDINHQYTKSYEFETDYHFYVKRYIHPDLEYFSILRPLYEIQISKIFSNFNKFHNVFVSCNYGKWCGKCSKCAFIYLSLYPYLNTNNLNNIIGNDMLNDPDLLETYKMLTGQTKHKPFECVGTIQENKIGIQLAIEKANLQKEFPNNLKFFKNKFKTGNDLLYEYDDDNLIPNNLKRKVKKIIQRYINNVEGYSLNSPKKCNFYCKKNIFFVLLIILIIFFLLLIIILI